MNLNFKIVNCTLYVYTDCYLYILTKRNSWILLVRYFNTCKWPFWWCWQQPRRVRRRLNPLGADLRSLTLRESKPRQLPHHRPRSHQSLARQMACDFQRRKDRGPNHLKTSRYVSLQNQPFLLQSDSQPSPTYNLLYHWAPRKLFVQDRGFNDHREPPLEQTHLKCTQKCQQSYFIPLQSQKSYEQILPREHLHLPHSLEHGIP